MFRRIALVMLAAIVAISVASVIAVSAGTLPRNCNFTGHDQVALGNSRTWLTNISGCASGYPIQYNRTACIYRNVSGVFWYSGPIRKGAGSSSSNYSGVTCNQFPFPSVVQVWLFYNAGSGWGNKRLF